MTTDQPTYASSGVDVAAEEAAMGGLLGWVRKATEACDGPGRPLVGGGYFAEVVELGAGSGIGLAVCCDGVGTKLVIAQLLDRYDTIAIDLIAMNVNDLICVGARPIAFLDYLAIERPDPVFFEAFGRGLHEGARQAGVSIPGGEIAQVGEIIRGIRPGRAFELAGFSVGTVALDRIIDGTKTTSGQVVIGLASAGIHSNGLSLARRVLLGDRDLDAAAEALAERPEELGGASIGEALLEPTRIYVKPILELLAADDVTVTACAHITGDGLLNLRRVAAPVGFEIDAMPEAPGIFRLIAERGGIPTDEMHTAFNMGVGFCVTVPEDHVDRALAVLSGAGVEAGPIGRTTDDAERTVTLPRAGIAGRGRRFAAL